MRRSLIFSIFLVAVVSIAGQAQPNAVEKAHSRKIPLHSTPQRDAAGQATAEQKAAIKAGLQKQFALFRRSIAAVVPAGSAKTVPEIQTLERQKVAVQSLRVRSNAVPVAPSKLATPPATPNVVPVAPLKLATPPATPTPANQRATATRSTVAVGAALPQERQAAASSATPPTYPTPNPKDVMSHAAILCRTAQIYRVNNSASGVVFTQDPAYNDYIIQGCGFGTQTGQVYLSGAVSNGRIPMIVKQWGPEQIEAQVLPGLTGVRDGWPDLIVEVPGSGRAKFPNNRFYAQRQSVPLATVPLNAAHLANSKSADFEYCPAGNNIGGCMFFYSGGPITSPSNGVDRDSALTGNSFDPGEDIYDFSQLAPGFVLEGAGIYWYGDSETMCKDWADEVKNGDSVEYSTQGKYSVWRKGKAQVVVDWGVDQCTWKWLGFLPISRFHGSGYSLVVYVKGPIGLDPWTGNPKY